MEGTRLGKTRPTVVEIGLLYKKGLTNTWSTEQGIVLNIHLKQILKISSQGAVLRYQNTPYMGL